MQDLIKEIGYRLDNVTLDDVTRDLLERAKFALQNAKYEIAELEDEIEDLRWNAMGEDL